MSSRELGMHCRHPPVIPALETEAGEGGVGFKVSLGNITKPYLTKQEEEEEHGEEEATAAPGTADRLV